MTVKDIAIVAASILQADDVLEFLEQYGANVQDEPPKPEGDVKTLVACVNLALAESAARAWGAQVRHMTNARNSATNRWDKRCFCIRFPLLC